MYEEQEDDRVLAWFSWPILGCGAVTIELFFDDDCVPETEAAGWLEQQG